MDHFFLFLWALRVSCTRLDEWRDSLRNVCCVCQSIFAGKEPKPSWAPSLLPAERRPDTHVITVETHNIANWFVAYGNLQGSCRWKSAVNDWQYPGISKYGGSQWVSELVSQSVRKQKCSDLCFTSPKPPGAVSHDKSKKNHQSINFNAHKRVSFHISVF